MRHFIAAAMILFAGNIFAIPQLSKTCTGFLVEVRKDAKSIKVKRAVETSATFYFSEEDEWTTHGSYMIDFTYDGDKGVGHTKSDTMSIDTDRDSLKGVWIIEPQDNNRVGIYLEEKDEEITYSVSGTLTCLETKKVGEHEDVPDSKD